MLHNEVYWYFTSNAFGFSRNESVNLQSQVSLLLYYSRAWTWKREFNLPWREAGPPNHLGEKVDSDQLVVNTELSLQQRDSVLVLHVERVCLLEERISQPPEPGRVRVVPPRVRVVAMALRYCLPY